MTWPSAGNPPYNNIIGVDPQLTDPTQGDYRPAPGSPALGYGCETFGAPRPPDADAEPAVDRPGEGRRFVRRPPGEGGHLDNLRVSGLISSDTLWSADTIRVAGELTIADGATLTIAPGTLVLFEGYFALAVQGRLLAIGAPEARIRLDSAEAEDWTAAPNTTGAWGGIRFSGTRAGNGRSLLEWCDLEHTKGIEARKRGGALSLIDCSGLDVRNCRFRWNAADYGGVLFCEHMASPTMTGCLLTDNYAYVAGSAIYCIDSYPHLTANTITSNVCANPEYMYDTAAVHNHLSKCWMVGNIVYGNFSNYFLPMELREPKPFTVRHCDVRYGIAGEGDIDLDPLFDGSGAHPHRLSEGSPCRNAGPAGVAGLDLLDLDLAGTWRVIDGRIDIGAYEAGDPAAVPGSPGGPGAPGDLADGDGGAVRLLACAPNPVTNQAVLRLRLPTAAHLHLTLHDPTGRRVALLRDETAPSGDRVVSWDGTDESGRRLAPGV